MNGQVYGYIRVSSREQNEERQLISLREVQVPEENTFIAVSYTHLTLPTTPYV